MSKLEGLKQKLAIFQNRFTMLSRELEESVQRNQGLETRLELVKFQVQQYKEIKTFLKNTGWRPELFIN